MTTETSIVIPSNPEDIKKIKSAVDESVIKKIQNKINDEAIADIRNSICDEYGIPKPMFNKMVRVSVKESYNEETQKAENFELLYETVMKENQ